MLFTRATRSLSSEWWWLLNEWWHWSFYDGVDVLYMPMPMTSEWSCQWWPTMVLMVVVVVVVVVMLYKSMIMRQSLSGIRLQADLVQGGRRQLHLWPGLHSPAHGDNYYHNWSHCVARAPLVFLRSWVALYFKVRQSLNQSVRDLWHLTRSPLNSIFNMYLGVHALFWPCAVKK